ncbi:MAG: BolA family protein [Janthinobacterium lividum]
MNDIKADASMDTTQNAAAVDAGLPAVNTAGAVPRGGALGPWIDARLRAALSPTAISVEDDSARHAGHAGAAEGSHFNVLVVSAAFAGRSRVARHRLVYDALADAMRNGIHALAIIAHTPEEFATRTPR